LLIRAPGYHAQRIDVPTSTMDIAPTLYALANVKPPLRVQGTALLADDPHPCAAITL